MPSAPRGALAITFSVDSVDDGALPVEDALEAAVMEAPEAAVAVEAAGVADAAAVDAAPIVTAAPSPVSGAGMGVQTTKMPPA